MLLKLLIKINEKDYKSNVVDSKGKWIHKYRKPESQARSERGMQTFNNMFKKNYKWQF
jgi:hypothetical protein